MSSYHIHISKVKLLYVSLIAFAFNCIMVFVITVNDRHSYRTNEQYDINSDIPQRPLKKILLWNNYWGLESSGWESVFLRLVSGECPVHQCQLMYDHRLLDIADAVLLHPFDLKPDYVFPPHHPPEQIWIFFSLESPSTLVYDRKIDLDKFKGMFNWTMTYKRDSDVVVPYGQVIQDTQTTIKKNYWKTKTRKTLAIWMVSHCNTWSRREVFVKELLKHMNVDVYGSCGKMKCGEHLTVRNMIRKGIIKTDACDATIEEYFFYFAFENSICDDYVSEKLYKALQLDVVPVVFGGADYDDFAPPGSYINALNYPNPKTLAEHLQFIASSEEQYNKYFEWKSSYKIKLGHPFGAFICDLCAKLHGEPTQHSTHVSQTGNKVKGLETVVKGKDANGSYPDLFSWFFVGSSCRSW